MMTKSPLFPYSMEPCLSDIPREAAALIVAAARASGMVMWRLTQARCITIGWRGGDGRKGGGVRGGGGGGRGEGWEGGKVGKVKEVGGKEGERGEGGEGGRERREWGRREGMKEKKKRGRGGRDRWKKGGRSREWEEGSE